MTIRPIALSEATAEQRFAYAASFLNLPVDSTDSPDAILSKIQAAQPGVTQIFVQDADTPADVAAAETAEVELKPEESSGRSTGTLGKGDPRAVIFIDILDTEDGSGSRDVLVGVNGRAWQLKRGHDLPVPWRVCAALDDAVADIVRHSQEEGHEGEVIVRPTKRIPYRFIEKPPQAEIDAWLERTGAEFCA